jgi:hypothetical protein
MSDTTLDFFEDVNEDVLEFPDFEPGQSRSTIYKVGQVTQFDLPDVDNTAGLIELRSARLVRVRARRQKNNNDKVQLVTFMEIVTDETLAKVGTEEGAKAEHLRPYTHPQFANWQDRSKRPHRIYAQNWGSDEQAVLEMVNFCRHHFGFRVTKNPPMNTRANAQYRQQIPYLFEARPALSLMTSQSGTQDWSKFGAPVQAFEIRVNPNYERGFKSFIHGISENLQRIVLAHQVANPDERALALQQASRFSGSITGIGQGNDGQDWARHCDITTIAVGENSNLSEFRIWNPGQDSDLVLDDLSGANIPVPEEDQGPLTLGDLGLNPTVNDDDVAKVTPVNEEPF